MQYNIGFEGNKSELSSEFVEVQKKNSEESPSELPTRNSTREKVRENLAFFCYTRDTACTDGW